MKRVKPIAATEDDVKNFDNQGFLRKLTRYALRLGRPVIEQLYGLYFVLRSNNTPMRSKMLIVGALLYFISPIDAIPDMLTPFGFSDDIAVIAMVYKLIKEYLTDDLRQQAKSAAEALFKRAQ